MATRPEDLNLPASVVTKLVKDSLPAHVNVSKEARTAIGRAASIFVLYTTANANNVAASEKRKTITPEDILSAMRDMEMDQFVNPLRKCLDAYRKSSATAKTKAAAKTPTAPKGGVTKKPSPKKATVSKTAPIEIDPEASNVKSATEISVVNRDKVTSHVVSSTTMLRAQEDSDLETSSSASSSEVETVKRPDAKHGFTNVQSTGANTVGTSSVKKVDEDAPMLENTDEDSDESSD